MQLTILPFLLALAALGWLLWQTAQALSGAAAPSRAAFERASDRDDLLRTKRRLLEDIKEVDFDHRSGKLDDKDHRAMVRELKLRVVDVMKRIDVMDRVEERGARIEEELRRRLAAATAPGGSAPACPECGRPHEPGDRFCQGCGHGLTLACSCGQALAWDSKFCKSCGASVAA